VTQCAGHADPRQLSEIVDLPLDADDRIQTQQFDCDRRVSQVDGGGAKRSDHRRWKRIHVDLQSDRQGGGGIDVRNHLAHPQHVGPELLVSECVVAENIPAAIATWITVVSGRRGGQYSCHREEVHHRNATDQSHHPARSFRSSLFRVRNVRKVTPQQR
jgi:hypothetical protein